MTDLLRYVRHPASTNTSTASWLYKERPLGAGRHQILLGSNPLHLARINSVRPLCSHPGVRGFYQPARFPGVTTDPTGRPEPFNIDWSLSPKDGGVSLDLGVHYVWRYGADTRYPVLRCNVCVQLENAGDTVGVLLGVAPGERFLVDGDVFDNWAHTGDTLVTEKTLQVSLGDSSVAPRNYALIGGTSTADPEERAELLTFRAFIGAYNDSATNSPGRRANILGISLFLEPPA